MTVLECKLACFNMVDKSFYSDLHQLMGIGTARGAGSNLEVEGTTPARSMFRGVHY
jgi:hypothetical protein